MKDKTDSLGYHNFRLKVLFPVALIIHICMFVNSISDAIVLSYLYLIDAALCLVWFSLAVPTFIGLFRKKESAYRWNRVFETYMISYLAIRALLYVILMHSVSVGLLLLMATFVVIHALELVYYRNRKDVFDRQ